MNVKYYKKDILRMILDGFCNDFAVKTIHYIKENNLSKYPFMLRLEASLDDASFYDEIDFEFNIKKITCNLTFDEFNLHFDYVFANNLENNVGLFAKEVVSVVAETLEEKILTNSQKNKYVN